MFGAVAVPQELHRHRVLPRHATRRSSRSTSRRRSARASSGPSRSPRRIEDAVDKHAGQTRRHARRDHDDLRRRPAAGPDARCSRRTPARTPATCWSTWCRGRSASARDVQAAETVRAALRDALPGTQVYFFIGGIVKRILNFGAPAPIDVEILGHDLDGGSDYAKQRHGASCARSTDERRQAAAHRRADHRARRTTPSSTSIVDRAEGGRRWASPSSRVAQTVLTSLVGNTPVRAHPVHRPEDRQRVLHQRAAGRRATGRTSTTSASMFVRTPGGGDGAARHHGHGRARQRPGGHQPQVPAAHRRRHGQRRARARTWAARATRCRSVLRRDAAARGLHACSSAARPQAQQKAFGGLSFAALMAIVLVYMVLASQFKSLIDPLVIMFSVPLGRDGRVPGALPDRARRCQREQLHGHHHDGRHRGLERRAAGRLRQRAARARARRSSRRPSRPGARGCARS